MRGGFAFSLLFSLVLCSAFAPAAARPLTVFAAASLRESLDAIAQAWRVAGHGEVAISYAASSTLARQIEQGAPADVFISADADWMDYLQRRGLIDPASRFVFDGNALVVIVPAGSKLASIDPDRAGAWAAALAGGRLAVAETGSVPAGRYARQALQALGVWNTVKAHLAQAENVRAALEYVARGDAPLGIVYRTDARAEPRVRVVGEFADTTHAPIVYPAARIAASTMPRQAAAFLAFLRGPRAAAINARLGFVAAGDRR